MSALKLRAGVYACITQGYCVFLDLDRDAYSALPCPANEHGVIDLDAALQLHRDTLALAGLLQPGGASDSPKASRAVKRHLLAPWDQRAFGLPRDDAVALKIMPRDVADVLISCCRAQLALRFQPLRRTVEGVRIKQASALRSARNDGELRRLCLIFAHVRPYFPRDYACLFEALALIYFVRMRGHHPNWIFGVQIQPFAAHCWLQSDERALNENVEFANRFTPIMVV